MNKNIKYLLLTALLWVSLSQADVPSSFLSEVKIESEKYTKLSENAVSVELINEGKKGEVNTQLINLVSDKDKRAVDFFILSNMLFKADVALSDTYIKKANQMLPNNPYIVFELAMHEHRAEDCKAALGLYKQAGAMVGAFAKSDKLWAYVTHCHLVLGDYKEALQSWRKVDFRSKHASIEHSMYDIFSTRDPDIERGKLLKLVASDASDGACQLIKLDRRWENDWWNINVNNEYLRRDTAFLTKLAKHRSNIDTEVKFCLDAVTMNDTEFRNFVEASNYWGKRYQPPSNSSAMYELVYQLTNRKLAAPQEVLDHYETYLLNVRKEAPEDKNTLDVLAFLYSATRQSEKLAVLDLYGWKSLKVQAYAESYIVGLNQKSDDYERLVEEASSDFPNSVIIQRANLTLHDKSQAKPIYLMRFVAAQFANVKNHMLGPYKLNDYMASLEYEMQAFKNH